MTNETNKFIDRWVRGTIRKLSAYHVPPAQGFVKLDAMENPYGWPADMQAAWLELIRQAALNRYPDPSAHELTAVLRTAMAIPADYDILLGNGSDELIQMLMLAVAEPGRVVMAPEPAFVMYRMIAELTGMDYVGVPLRAADFALDMPALLAAIDKHQPALLFLAYPNNPTGNLFAAEDMERLITACPGLVVVDEAYLPFAEASFLDRLARFENLLILRTVSKMGLAGLRLGLLIGAPAWLAEIDKTRLPYNINVLTQLSVAFALRHQAVLDEQTALIRAERARVFAVLADLPGITAWPSRANFILLRVPNGRADAMFAALKNSGVLIKNLHPQGGMLSDCLRVTIGTPEENDAFLAAFNQALAI